MTTGCAATAARISSRRALIGSAGSNRIAEKSAAFPQDCAMKEGERQE